MNLKLNEFNFLLSIFQLIIVIDLFFLFQKENYPNRQDIIDSVWQ